MQISEKKDGRNILILFFKLEILTLKQGSGFFLEETGIAIPGKCHLGSWKRDVGASHCVFRNQTVALSWFALATVGLRRDWSKCWLKFLVDTLVFEIIFVLKRVGPFQATVQGNWVFWKAWNSWLQHKCGPGDQEYTEFPAPAWIVIPWELEPSLALVSEWPWLHGSCWEELIPWTAGAGHPWKSDYFGLPSAGSTCCIQHPK